MEKRTCQSLRTVNDCVYGIVLIPLYARKVIETPLFQRLGRIRQLGNLSWAWPSATHTRLEHSLGTLHLAETYSTHFEFKNVVREAFGLASLLHDIAHGPYSHAFETAIKKSKPHHPICKTFEDHDVYRIRLLLEDDALQKAISKENISSILSIWSGQHDGKSSLSKEEVQVCHALLAGVAGVDRLDYLLRDSYHTTPQRRIDKTCVESIIINTCLDWKRGMISYSFKGLRYVKLLMEERRYMYREVYFHARSVAADIALAEAISHDVDRVHDMLKDFETFDDGAISQLARTNPLMRRFVRGEHQRLSQEPTPDGKPYLVRTIKGNRGDALRFVDHAKDFALDADERVCFYSHPC